MPYQGRIAWPTLRQAPMMKNGMRRPSSVGIEQARPHVSKSIGPTWLYRGAHEGLAMQQLDWLHSEGRCNKGLHAF